MVQRCELRWAEDDKVIHVAIGRNAEFAKSHGEGLERVDAPAIPERKERGLEEAPGASVWVPQRHRVELWLIGEELVVSVSEIDLREDRDKFSFGGASGRTRGRVLVEETAWAAAA